MHASRHPGRRAALAAVVLWLAAPPLLAPAVETTVSPAIARWTFDEGKGDVAGDGADGAANGKIVKAAWGEGRQSGALVFDDYSLNNYLKPDVGLATRVVVPDCGKLNLQGSFTLRATIFPTRAPLFYGGIVEKGGGYGSCYRLVLLRDLRVRAAAGVAHVSLTTAEPIKPGVWHDIELKVEGDTISLSVDGKDQGRAKGLKGPFACKSDLVIGERFSGRIDEISLTAP